MIGGDEGDVAKIIIGYSGNTKVGIFTPIQHVPLAQATVYNVLNCRSHQHFWVRLHFRLCCITVYHRKLSM